MDSRFYGNDKRSVISNRSFLLPPLSPVIPVSLLSSRPIPPVIPILSSRLLAPVITAFSCHSRPLTLSSSIRLRMHYLTGNLNLRSDWIPVFTGMTKEVLFLTPLFCHSRSLLSFLLSRSLHPVIPDSDRESKPTE